MRLLIDESVDKRIADALAAADHEVVEVRLQHAGIADADVAALAIASNRIVVTVDRDFGGLAFRDGVPMPGVIFLRMAGRPHEERTGHILRAIAAFGDRIGVSMVVVEADKIRIRPLLRLV